jgi:hypothetical protein
MSEELIIPEEFSKIIKDFVSDIKTTFPEVDGLINKWWKSNEFFSYIEDEKEREEKINESRKTSIKFLFKFCQKKYPPRFFEILYQNDSIFKEDSDADTEFLPHIHFKNLWNFDISDKTRDTIWKYLQLILFSIIGSINDKEAFGDSAKLFEAINEDEFKTKLEETLSQMQNIFDISGNMNLDDNDALNEKINMENIPNPEDIHEHISGMLNGKLGMLAKEIAEETANNLNLDMDNTTDMKDVFNKLIKNPTKLMGLVKTVGDKLDQRIKSGEIKESEIMSEASDILNKMKNMPGMGNIQQMLNKMGMSGMGKGGKVNMGAMEAQLNRNMKSAQMKERIRAKAEAIRISKEKQILKYPNNNDHISDINNNFTDEHIASIFSTGEKVEKTPRSQKQETTSSKTKNKKNKK